MTGVRVLIAGGGSAGHVQPALAVADALMRADPSTRIICLGTAGGLETILVPEAGYDLRLIPEVKFRRKINREALRIPGRLVGTVRAAASVIRSERIDVVIGFGGYVALPAYLAARLSLRHRVPVLVHEANARAGIANKVGARLAAVVAAAVPGSGLRGAVVVGNPVRRSLSGLDLTGLRAQAREYFGLDPDAPTLLVIGGSLGAIKLNDAFSSVATELGRAGVGVLHAHGRAKPVVLPAAEPDVPPYIPTPYLDRMDLAYAAADLIVARSGAITVAEIGALKVPVVYVPLAFGNGEQRLNAVPQVESGAALVIDEDKLTPGAILDRIVPLVKDPDRLARMSAAAGSSTTLDADDVIARLVLGAVGPRAEDRQGSVTRGSVDNVSGGSRSTDIGSGETGSGGTGSGNIGAGDMSGGATVLPLVPPVAADGTSLARVHMVGIGGAGMSAIARILADRGLPVSGSDAKGSHVLTGLAQRGVLTAIGHAGKNLDLLRGGPTAVVVSTAIRPSNAEIVEARERGIPVLQRAVALAALMADHRSICVAGTHGKTSTTSMLTVALQGAGLDPSFAIGGELNESGSGAHHGAGDIFVAEADESDGSFLAFAPHGAIITNLEADHLDHHGTVEAYTAVFRQFVDRIRPGGFLVLCVDDPGTGTLISELAGQPGSPRIITYGFGSGADLRITEHRPDGHGGTAMVQIAGDVDVLLRLAVPGAHMLSNAVAALAAGIALGVPAGTMSAGLAAYTGVRRRFEYKGRAAGVSVYDDYAHHPTEVAAQLLAARSVLSEPDDAGRLVVIFQPHLYSRTVAFAAEFARALSAADVVIVLDVYGAREDPLPGVSGELITRQIPAAGEVDGVSAGVSAGGVGRQVRYVPSLAAVPETVGNLVRPGDLVITMGAGDVTMLGPQLLEYLESR